MKKEQKIKKKSLFNIKRMFNIYDYFYCSINKTKPSNNNNNTNKIIYLI